LILVDHYENYVHFMNIVTKNDLGYTQNLVQQANNEINLPS